MIRTPSISPGRLWLVVMGAMLASAALAQEPPPDAAEGSSTADAKGVLDSVSELFGTLPPAAKDDQSGDPSSAKDSVETRSAEQAGKPADTKSKIQTDYSSAVREAQLNSRPLLVVCGAEWCSWCRKLEAELETAEAVSILREWIVVKIDIDDEPEIAGRLEVSALPALRILGPLQSVVASREGYLAAAELKQWLADTRTGADPAMHKVLYDTAEPDDAAIEQLIAMLAEPSPLVRAAAIERLAAHPSQSAGPLVQVLKTGRLIQQLSACEALRKWQAPIGTIDPWQLETLRAEQFSSLVEWSRQRMDADASDNDTSGTPNPAVEFDAQSANVLLQRLMKAEPAQRSSLLAQLLGMGGPLAVEVRSRLNASDAVDDAARESLRELLYNLLASRKLRLQQSGVIAALARLDLESHRQAAATILDKSANVDLPLVDELARDVDPLIRELAVRALGRLGHLNDDDLIQRLLNDDNPNVRTAVLRVLTEHPSDESVASLCAYLRQETDEDLLVHGAKCLGQLRRQGEAMTALAQLAANPSWRVRATAIEAAGQAIQANSGDAPLVWAGSKKGNVPQELADAIVAAAFEQDAFVAATATKLLPTLIEDDGVDEKTLQTIATALADHPERLQSLVEAAEGDARFSFATGRSADSFASLVKLAKGWLVDGEPEQIRSATIILSRLAPTELDKRVGNLIASSDRTIRLAGLRAAIHSIEAYRATSVTTAASQWASQSAEANSRDRPAITPWHDLPDAGTQQVGESPLDVEPPTRRTPPSDDAPQSDSGASGDAVAEERASRAKALAAASGLFGDLPSQETLPIEASASLPRDSSLPNIEKDEVKTPRPSEWLQHWQSGVEQDRPEWLTACEAPAQNLLSSDDPVERTWAFALWLVLGHTDRVDELLSVLDAPAANEASPIDIPRLELLSWLPADKRLAECKQRLAEAGDDGETAIETLRQCTLIDDQQLADWIFEQLNHPFLSDSKLRASLARVALGSRIGGFADDQLLTTLSAENYEFGAQAPYRVVREKQSPRIPGRIEACEWLRQRYHSATSDRQRAIALMAVAQLDHTTAVDAALGAVQEADDESELLRIALSILLGDAATPSAQRATALLSHRLPAVRGAALAFLASPGSQFGDEQALVPTALEESVLPGLWRATEQFPIDDLRTLAAEGDDLQRSQAGLLLLAAGERVDLPQLERALAAPDGDQAKLCIAVALAKARRTDQEAITHYEQTYAESDDNNDPQMAQIAAALYETLRNLPGDEIAKLRRRMRHEKGSSLFNNLTGGLFGDF